MSDLVFIAFPTEQKAEEVRQKILAMQREISDRARRCRRRGQGRAGQIKLNQLINLTTTGAASGALWAR